MKSACVRFSSLPVAPKALRRRITSCAFAVCQLFVSIRGLFLRLFPDSLRLCFFVPLREILFASIRSLSAIVRRQPDDGGSLPGAYSARTPLCFLISSCETRSKLR